MSRRRATLAGCIDLAPTYQRPANPAPTAFPTGPAYAPAPTAEAAPVGWRDFFSDPKLKRGDRPRRWPTIATCAIAVANIAAARAQYHVQRAALFPTIAANATATYGQEPASVVSGGAVSPGQSSTFNERLYSLTAGFTAWQLDLFGKVRNLTRAAQEQYFATREARDDAQLVLVAEVASRLSRPGARTARCWPSPRTTLVSTPGLAGSHPGAPHQRRGLRAGRRPGQDPRRAGPASRSPA